VKPLSLRLRLALGFLIVALLPLAGLAWFYLYTFERSLTAAALQNIASIADKKSDQINSYISERLADARSFAGQDQMRAALPALAADFRRGGLSATRDTAAHYRVPFATLSEQGEYHDVLLIDDQGNVVFSLRAEADLGTNLLDGPYRTSGLAAGFRQAMTFLHIDLSRFAPYPPSNNAIAAFIVAPLLDHGRPIGALALQVNLATLMPVVADRTGLGRTGETVLAVQDGHGVRYTIPLARMPGAPFTNVIPLAQAAEPMRRALTGNQGRGLVHDYAGREVAASWHYLPALGWGMVVKIDTDEVLAPLHATQRTIVLAFAFFVLLSAGAAHSLGRRFMRTETALGRSLEQLRDAQRIARLGSWRLNLKTRRLDWSDEAFRIFELDPTRFGANYQTFLEAVHPDDRERVDQAYQASLTSRKPYAISHRLLFADGRIKHVHEHGETLYAPDGTPRVSRGTVQDITELRRAEDALQLYANIFEHSGEAILVTDHDNRIIAINPAFSRQTGYRLEDVAGKNPSLLSSGRTPPDTYENMWTALAESGYWQGELWDRDRHDEIYPKWAAISAIRDEHGAVTHYIASFTDISERKAAEERIEHLAHHDSLTGLVNRYNLEIRLSQALLSAHREGTMLAVLFIDLDRFKVINDTLGHQIGDLLLVEVARRLKLCVRESDIVARQGGDEFVVVLTGLESPEGASPLAAKILHDLNAPYHINGDRLYTSPSIGISIYPNDGTDAGILMKNADTAMYHAKEQGRNNLQYFTAALNAAASERLLLERELRTAIEEGQFELHYQPQFSAQSDRCARPCAMEALIRWRHPRRGLVQPAKFIPIAEETGLIQTIGDWVLDEACRRFARWKAADIGPSRVAVNVSAQQLSDPALVTKVAAVLQRYGLRDNELELEITESVAMSDPVSAGKTLQALRSLGVTLAIDDFGTGYSSLAYLKRLPIQVLKLDREFVRDIESDENDAAISAATLALAHGLGLIVVAEGIETEGQSRFLKAHGCDLLQGYLYGRPAPAETWTARWSLDCNKTT